MKQEYSLAQTILQVENVSLRFGDKLILRDINVAVQDVQRPAPITQGQVIGFLGPSGRGKTQLSKILSGLHLPTTGTVMINNPPVPVRAGMVGYVTQDYILRRNRTLIGNLLLAARMAGMDKVVSTAKAMEYVEMFELGNFIHQYPAQLSGGERQRVAIAQQLLCSDHYLIMDEPFSGLDPVMKEKVCDLIIHVSLMDELNTIIVISHDIRAVLKVSETVWLLGQDRDADRNLIPGSYIKKQYDLMSEGLCWDAETCKTPAFSSMVETIESDFRDL